MTNHYDLVVVGASVSAEALVSQLRSSEYDGKILVVDEDVEMPYERPPLSKSYLADQDASLLEVDWSDLSEIKGAKATGINVAAKTVDIFDIQTEESTTLNYNKLVIASGATPVKLPFEPPNVSKLRTKKDVDTINQHLKKGGRVGIVGAGAIGAELAATLANLDISVEIFDLAAGPLDRLLSGYFGEEITSWLEDLGIKCHWQANITNITGDFGSFRVEIDGTPTDEFDLLVSAVGVRPNIDWLNGSDLLTENRLLSDEHGNVLVTGKPLPDVYSVGDVSTTVLGNGEIVRTESWSAAAENGMLLAHRITGEEEPEKEMTYFWSDIGNKKIQIIGSIPKSAKFEKEFENPKRGGILYKAIDEQTGKETGWIGINAQPQIAKIRFS